MSHHCAAALLDSKLQVLDNLRSGWSPGKRSVELPGKYHLGHTHTVRVQLCKFLTFCEVAITFSLIDPIQHDCDCDCRSSHKCAVDVQK